MDSFFSKDELKDIGFKSFGTSVKISRKASIYSANQISIGNNVRVDDFCILSGKIDLHNFIHIGAYSALFGGEAGIEIMDFANVSSRVSIYALMDDLSGETLSSPIIPDKYKNVTHKKIVIGKHSIVAASSVVLPGAYISEGCSFGAFSLIKTRTEPWTIYAGIPCKKIKCRKQDLLQLEKQFLEEIKPNEDDT